MNPANGPNARLLHPYRPPSSGWREDRNTMHTDKGRNITMPPNTHTISELGPVAAAVAVHCRLQPAVTMNSATSRTPSARVRSGVIGDEFITHAPRLSFCRSRPRPASAGPNCVWPSGFLKTLWEYRQHPELRCGALTSLIRSDVDGFWP